MRGCVKGMNVHSPILPKAINLRVRILRHLISRFGLWGADRQSDIHRHPSNVQPTYEIGIYEVEFDTGSHRQGCKC